MISKINLHDIVYMHDNAGNIYADEIIGISGKVGELVIFHCHGVSFDYTAVGHRIFLSKEDAQKHIKETEGRN